MIKPSCAELHKHSWFSYRGGADLLQQIMQQDNESMYQIIWLYSHDDLRYSYPSTYPRAYVVLIQ